MPNNLKNKLTLVLEDCEGLKRFELVQRLERVVLEEINWLTNEHKIDSYDINTIQSRAAALYAARRLDEGALGKIHGDSNQIRTLCLVEATVEFFRGKGMVGFTTSYNKK